MLSKILWYHIIEPHRSSSINRTPRGRKIRHFQWSGRMQLTPDSVALITDGIAVPQSTAESRNAAAVASFQMEVEAAALVCLSHFPYIFTP